MEVSNTSSAVTNRLFERPELNRDQEQRQPRQQSAGVEVQISREARTTFASQASLATQPLTLSEPPQPSAQVANAQSRPVTVNFDDENLANSNSESRANTELNQQSRSVEPLQTPQVNEAPASSASVEEVATNNQDNPAQAVNTSLNNSVQQPVANSVQTPANQVTLDIDIREIISEATEEDESALRAAENQTQQVDRNSTSQQGLNVGADTENEITSVVAPNDEGVQADEPELVTIPNPAVAQPEDVVANESSNTAQSTTAETEEPAVQANTSAAIDQFRQVALSDQERQIIESFDV